MTQFTKTTLKAELKRLAPFLYANEMELLLTSGFCMGAGEIAYTTTDGLCSVSKFSLDTAIRDGRTNNMFDFPTAERLVA